MEGLSMIQQRHVISGIAGLLLAGAIAGSTAWAEQDTKVVEGENATKQLLLLMDTDKDGKVSKQEFMAYMDAEFGKLDLNGDGKLDVKELTQLKIRHTNGLHK
jgi:5S rRNA maturation endonuclease (ribonuclease M5)